MPDLIVLRLHPVKPEAAAQFTNYLNNLTIQAFDLSVSHPAGEHPAGMQPDGELIGEVKNPPDAGAQTGIVQHEVDDVLGFPHPAAAATAVIEFTPPAGGHVEYPGEGTSQQGYSDIRLEITRDGKKIVDRTIDYNV